MIKELHRKAEELAKLPYRVEVVLDETTEGKPIYVARTPELEGCFSQGETIEEAIKNLYAAREDFIESLLADGLAVPEPLIYATTTAASLVYTLTLKNEPIREKGQSYPTGEPLFQYEGIIRLS